MERGIGERRTETMKTMITSSRLRPRRCWRSPHFTGCESTEAAATSAAASITAWGSMTPGITATTTTTGHHRHPAARPARFGGAPGTSDCGAAAGLAAFAGSPAHAVHPVVAQTQVGRWRWQAALTWIFHTPHESASPVGAGVRRRGTLSCVRFRAPLGVR